MNVRVGFRRCVILHDFGIHVKRIYIVVFPGDYLASSSNSVSDSLNKQIRPN